MSCEVGCLSPENLSRCRRVTRVMASLPSAFFSITPTASSMYSSSTNLFLHAMARNVSMWQLDREATNASSGSTNFGLPRYAGAADACISCPPSNFQVWSREYFWYSNGLSLRSQVRVTLCSDMRLDKTPRRMGQAFRFRCQPEPSGAGGSLEVP